MRRLTKKLLPLFAIAVIITTTFTGCVTMGFSGIEHVVVGKGEIVTKIYHVSDFGQLSIQLDADVYFTNEETDTIKIVMYENFERYIQISDNDFNEVGYLNIDSWRKLRTSNRNVTQIHIPVRAFETISLTGNINIKEAAHITSEQLIFLSSGVVNGELSLDAGELDLRVYGVGKLTLNGTADTATADITGSGTLNAFGLAAREMTVTVSGAGSVECNVSEKLTVNVSGSGTVRYRGDPEISKNISGVGKVSKAD